MNLSRNWSHENVHHVAHQTLHHQSCHYFSWACRLLWAPLAWLQFQATVSNTTQPNLNLKKKTIIITWRKKNSNVAKKEHYHKLLILYVSRWHWHWHWHWGASEGKRKVEARGDFGNCKSQSCSHRDHGRKVDQLVCHLLQQQQSRTQCSSPPTFSSPVSCLSIEMKCDCLLDWSCLSFLELYQILANVCQFHD